MRSRSEPEAIGILQHFRSEPNASAALKLVRDGELLLQAFRDANDEESTSISARPPRTTSKQDGKSGVAQVTPSDPGPNAYRPERESSQQYAKPNESNSGLTLKREFSSVQGDMDRLLALLHYIHAAPEAEAWNLLWQIRSSHDPFSALRTAQDGDLAMQQYLNSSWTERDNDGYLRILDATAMRQSPIKVPARPWTNIAGDGIISHLVSIFFVQEQQFLMPYVDKKIFLADMASGDHSNSQFCSPLLVNSICALSAVRCRYSKSISSWLSLFLFFSLHQPSSETMIELAVGISE